MNPRLSPPIKAGDNEGTGASSNKQNASLKRVQSSGTIHQTAASANNNSSNEALVSPYTVLIRNDHSDEAEGK